MGRPARTSQRSLSEGCGAPPNEGMAATEPCSFLSLSVIQLTSLLEFRPVSPLFPNSAETSSNGNARRAPTRSPAAAPRLSAASRPEPSPARLRSGSGAAPDEGAAILPRAGPPLPGAAPPPAVPPVGGRGRHSAAGSRAALRGCTGAARPCRPRRGAAQRCGSVVGFLPFLFFKSSAMWVELPVALIAGASQTSL